MGEIAKKRAAEFQPSIKRWLTKASTATQQAGTSGSLGACIANTANSNNVNNNVVIFENKIRDMNNEYNSKVKQFKNADETFKMITTNVNSIQTFPKRQKIYNLLKGDPDILLLVDTRIKEIDLVAYEGKNRTTIATDTDIRGVAFIIKSGVEPERFETNNVSGNLLAITIKVAGKIHGVIGAYGPNEENVSFFETELNNTIKTLKLAGAKEIILAGDLNVQIGKKIGYVNKRSRKGKALQKLINTHALNDHVSKVAEHTNTNPISFWRKNTIQRSNMLDEEYQASRLDHVLTTYPQDNIATKYLRFYPSDHAMTETIFKIKSRSGQTPWKLSRARDRR